MEFLVCSVATEGNAVVSLIEEAVQFWIRVHLFSFYSWITSQIYFEVERSENCQVDAPSDWFLCSPAGQLQQRHL